MLLCSGILAQEITVSGVYRGKNLFVQNPYTNVEGSFCISSIEVNGKTVISEPSSSAVVVDLSKFKIDDELTIVIRHHSVCKPRVLNANVLDAGSVFSYLQISADDASISWVTTGEMPGRGWYELLKLKLDGWIPIDTVLGKGNLDNNQYSIGADHYAGDNRFKLIYRYEGLEVISDEFEFYSDLDPITYYPETNIYDLISLSRPTDYVIKDPYGNELMRGVGQDIIVSPLPYGELVLIIENKEETIFRPEPEIIERPKKKSKKKSGTRL